MLRPRGRAGGVDEGRIVEPRRRNESVTRVEGPDGDVFRPRTRIEIAQAEKRSRGKIGGVQSAEIEDAGPGWPRPAGIRTGSRDRALPSGRRTAIPYETEAGVGGLRK